MGNNFLSRFGNAPLDRGRRCGVLGVVSVRVRSFKRFFFFGLRAPAEQQERTSLSLLRPISAFELKRWSMSAQIYKPNQIWKQEPRKRPYKEENNQHTELARCHPIKRNFSDSLRVTESSLIPIRLETQQQKKKKILKSMCVQTKKRKRTDKKKRKRRRSARSGRQRIRISALSSCTRYMGHSLNVRLVSPDRQWRSKRRPFRTTVSRIWRRPV